MDNLQKILLISLISISGTSWTISRIYQVNMMSAMMTPFDPLALSLFVTVWTAGMAAMMFPAISPVVLLYSRLTKQSSTGSSIIVEEREKGAYPVKMVLFIGSYLAVWSLAGLAILIGWSVPVNAVTAPLGSTSLAVVYGVILVVAGAYQFSPLKSRCLGYCESPMSLFMRRWKKGTSGAITMGSYHGFYCLGCCWPYFLIMVALGWMDILWMALFAGIIFGEKMWSKGIWVARAAGVGLVAVGALSILGVLAVSPSQDSMKMVDEMAMPEADAGMKSVDGKSEGMQVNGVLDSQAAEETMPGDGSDGMNS